MFWSSPSNSRTLFFFSQNTVLWNTVLQILVPVLNMLCISNYWKVATVRMQLIIGRTLKAIGIEQVFALFVCLDSTLSTADALSRKAPQQSFTLKAVSRRRSTPNDKVMRRCRRNRVDKSLQRLLVHMLFLVHTNQNSSLTLCNSSCQ